MFIRPCFRKKNGKRHAYWTLVESYRTERGPRQRVVAYLGGLDEEGRLGVQEFAEENRPADRQPTLFPEQRPQPRYVEVDPAGVCVENCREFGGPWLAWQLICKLGLDEFLKQTIPVGAEQIRGSVMSLVLVIARLCRPSSELHIAEHFYQQTALSDLLGVPDEKVNDARLYRTLDSRDRRGAPHPRRDRDPQTVRHQTHRPPGDPDPQTGTPTPLAPEINRPDVVKTFQTLPCGARTYVDN